MQVQRARLRSTDLGVSEKSLSPVIGDVSRFNWSDEMLAWQRTSFHFQPQRNWMNDPDGPMNYKGWYHLFYQYNPDSAVWGNITWGHAVSRDLIHWLYLPIAMDPDRWYDAGGVWTGSATLLPGAAPPLIMYTGSTNESVQVQCIARPADPSDPLLLHWVKSESNPVLLPPPGVGLTDFRDPTTAWYTPGTSTWHFSIGTRAGSTGMALLYTTRDFNNYTLLPEPLHAVPGTGMWECVDFYPVSSSTEKGLDTSTPPGPGVKHVLKVSRDDDRHDYYAVGVYDEETNTWSPDDREADVGIGLRYDYGKYYASKSFYDQETERRILWGWVGETDSESTDLEKGWASVQAIPRTVILDKKTGSNLLQWPVRELDKLRFLSHSFSDTKLEAGAVATIVVPRATQLDIELEFYLKPSSPAVSDAEAQPYKCSTSSGAAGRGALGPFGLLVLADDNRTEQTAVYFYVARRGNGAMQTFFCVDQRRSSKADDVLKPVYGSAVTVLDGEKLRLRTLVDHSIVESFAQGGRACITCRVYPTEAIYGNARVFLFNNATGATVTASSITVWEMDSAMLHPFSL